MKCNLRIYSALGMCFVLCGLSFGQGTHYNQPPQWPPVEPGSAEPAVVVQQADTSIAESEPVTYTLTVTIEPAGGGAVNRQPNLPRYTPGTKITMIAVPVEGYNFIGWTNASGRLVSTNPYFGGEIATNMNFTANFEPASPQEPQPTVQEPQATIDVQEAPQTDADTSPEVVAETPQAAANTAVAEEAEIATEPEPAEPSATIPPPAAEQTIRHGTAMNFVSISPGFLIVNTTLGAIIGTDWTKRTINKNRNMEINGIKDDVLSVFLLKARGVGSVTDIKSWGFGLALQYERPMPNISPNFSLMGRFSYSSLDIAMDFEDRYDDRNHITGTSSERVDEFFIDVDYYNWSVEAHGRYYLQADRPFFIDGVLGFGRAGMTVKKSQVEGQGDYVVQTPDGGFDVRSSEKITQFVNVPARRSYMTIGPMCGWRKVYGSFVWETSLGYLLGIGFGKSLADQVVDGNVSMPHTAGEDAKDVEDGVRDYMGIAEILSVTGGPRFRMTIGWGF